MGLWLGRVTDECKPATPVVLAPFLAQFEFSRDDDVVGCRRSFQRGRAVYDLSVLFECGPDKIEIFEMYSLEK